MANQEKEELAVELEQCIALLNTSGVNSKQIVKNTLSDIVKELRGEPANTEHGLPF